MRRLGMSLKIRKNSSTPRANAVVSRPKRHSQSRTKLRVTLLALRASQAVSTLLSTSSAPVHSTMARSSSLAMGQGRRSSVSKTSFKAARNPPNRRVENHTNNGSATAVMRTRWRMTPARAASTCANAASVPPPSVVGSRRARSSCRSTCWVVTWCSTRYPTMASSTATNGMMVSSRSNDRAPARKGMLSSKAASRVRRTTPVGDRCQPPWAFTRRARPPPRRRPAGPRGGGAWRRSAGASAPRGPSARPPRRLPSRRARPARRFFRPRARARGAPAWCATPRRPRERTGIPATPRSPRRTGTARIPCSARSLARLQVVGGRHRDRARLRVRLQRRPYEPIGDGTRVGHAQLLEQEGERLLEVGGDGRPDIARQVPQAPFERTDRLLAALVVELLLRVALLPLVFALGLHPLLQLAPQPRGQLGVVEHDVLKVGREVNLDRLALGKVAEGIGRERGGPVLHRPTQAVRGARVAGQRFQRVEVELHFGDGSVGQHHAAVARARLDGDLADARVLRSEEHTSELQSRV